MTKFNENKYNFWTLLKKYKIVIPMIQRDYVQGRKDKKVDEIRSNLIEKMRLALNGEKKLDFDFIYGSTRINEKGKEELSLLDGQQRMTTLFLLHVYLAKKDKKELDDEIIDVLHNFSYQNRVSSGEFCVSLVDKNIEIEKDKKISDSIKQKTWYYTEWNNDPTIKNMLNMLDDIHKTFYEYHVFDKLVEEDIISFIFIPLEKFNLTDELYIKMNSRGKRLTNFEIFKAKIIEILKQKGEDNLLEEFSRKIETDWAELFFEYKLEEFSRKIETDWAELFFEYKMEDEQTYDEIFMRYLYFITEMIYATTISEKTQKDSQKESPFEYSKNELYLDLKLVEETYNDRNNIQLLVDILNLWKNKEEITNDINNAFSSEYSDGKVMLFDQKDNINLFEKCIYYENFNFSDKIMLYAFLLKKKNNKNACNYDDLRIIRNFILNVRWFAKSPQAKYVSNLRYYMLKNFFTIFEKIIKAEEPYKYILEETFNEGKDYLTSEIEKAKLIENNAELKKIIFKCEDNNCTRGNIVNVIDLIELYKDKVINFIKFLEEKSYYPLFYRTMLSFDDYGIFIGGSRLGDRYLYGSTDTIYDILTFNNDKDVQIKIKKILEKIFERIHGKFDSDIKLLLNDIIEENLNMISKDVWRYNVVKYYEIWEMSFERIDNLNSEISYIFALKNSNMDISTFSKKSTNGRHINPYYKPILKQYNIKKTKDCYSTKDDNGEIELENIIIKIVNSDFCISSNIEQEKIINVFKTAKINEQGEIVIKYNYKLDYVEQLKQIIEEVKRLEI